MTLNGEELTQDGEITALRKKNIFNKRLAYSYSGNLQHARKFNVSMHVMDDDIAAYHMIFVLKGTVELVDIQTNFTYAKLESQQQNLFCIDPKKDRMVLTETNDDEIFCINVSESFIRRYLCDDHPALARLEKKADHGRPAPLFETNTHITPEVNAVLQGLAQLSHTNFSDQLILEAKTIKLFALQLSQFEQSSVSTLSPPLKKEELERMQRARELLLNHEGKKLSLRTLAHLVGTNEFTLKRDFKIAFGNTVYGYLNQHKMEQAKIMLIEKDITIAELSTKMGYSYPTHFSTAFKKYFGYLPNKIRSTKLSFVLAGETFPTIFEQVGLLTGLG